ncbi:uncharacterized protein BO66DRAFT_260612 [Aspergillus aculeatinus CBS 121060]|uniref:Uncharacterized protein n=1 Tax=Aspergillus aculeatinus CBS 121060 TaxID=1448322 RepID=A0ACD1GQZ1_9EURO|nr:hypothetical protein BO66DRAFT_260612 [Aspergillus aculeatinus CBS 121060]RAH63821.1 hypothetical protein BO66DRAFT_260612 [Aspergillus aculeatinus CBS 121060]
MSRKYQQTRRKRKETKSKYEKYRVEMPMTVSQSMRPALSHHVPYRPVPIRRFPRRERKKKGKDFTNIYQ